MAIATYKDFCIDAVDPHAAAQFWGPLLGWEVHLHDDGDADLREGQTVHVWINGVPEPVTVKNRLHIDINVHSLDPILATGATVVDIESYPWKTLRDPDGQLFDAFVRGPERPTGLYEMGWDVTGDAADAHELASWWADILGIAVHEEENGDGAFYLKQIPGAPFGAVTFAPVSEPKTTKNRIHLDVTTDNLEALVAKGATLVRAKGEDGIGWNVMTDPACNEFCAFTP